MRIIGGQARGRRLRVPAAGTRPTTDQGREGLFNTLAGLCDLDGARVLDLYAGSGAVGLEALSRGASVAVLVESDRRAAAVIRANIAAVALPGAQLVTSSVQRHLGQLAGERFDVVFADPPYALAEDELAVILQQLPPLLAADAIVVVERSLRSAEPQWPTALDTIRKRRYGDAVLWYRRAI